MENGTLDLVQLFDIADKLTTVGLLLILIWGIKERWIVPGWVYVNATDRIKTLEELANHHAKRIETKLESYEERERKRWEGRPDERP